MTFRFDWRITPFLLISPSMVFQEFKQTLFKLIFLIFIISTFISNINGDPKGPPVRTYSNVVYSTQNLYEQHIRNKRDLSGSNTLKLDISSNNRTFKLRLKVDDSIFHPGVVFENSEGPIQHDLHKPVVGYIEDDPGSNIRGTISSDGEFDGAILTGSGVEYYIEPSSRYWPKDTVKSTGIIYESKDAKWPNDSPEHYSTCESHKLHLLRRENLSEIDDSQTHFNLVNSKRRKRRWVVDHKKKTCMLYLQADHLFFNRFGSEEAAINVMTGHIQRVNEIYRHTDFNMDGEPDDIQFMIKRIKVHTKNRTTDPTYPYDGHYEVIKFLELFSEGDYDSFCLAYMFTFRDFEGGTLGLAWTGDLKNAGGVCEKKGHFRGGVKSLNTGIITLLNYGKVVSPAVSHVTLAHEIGHNFGSPHDPEGDRVCTPGGDDGNYIMFARATAGDRRNNNKFSICSLKSINPVLSIKARDTYGCFTEPQKSICGNGVVEEGEECDCGWEEDCKESCCNPMRRFPRKTEPPCRLKSNSQCSPSKGPCCTGNCTFTFGNKCRDDNGCRNVAYCDGSRAECPPSILKPNKTLCGRNSYVCYMGECTGSICLAYGLESCQCSQQTFDRSTKLCEVCCKLPGENQPCISSYDWNETPYDLPDVLAKPGTPCRNYTGYCDNYNSCREVDPSGPLATLRKLLSADEGLATIAEWVDNHWYAVLTAIGVLVILLVITAKICGRNAKKRLRKLTVLHSNIEAIQIQRSYLEDADGIGSATVHPTAVRKKIPFKKKVRERRNKTRNAQPKPKPKVESNGVKVRSPKNDTNPNKPGTSKDAISKNNDNGNPVPSTSKDNSSSSGLIVQSPLVDGSLTGALGSTEVPSSTPGPSQPSSSTSLVNHDHEPKTAIVPHASRKFGTSRRKRQDRTNRPKIRKPRTTTSATKPLSAGAHKSSGVGNKPSDGGAQSSVNNLTKPITGTEPKSTKKKNNKSNTDINTSNSSSNNPKLSSSLKTAEPKEKRNIQVVYRPPFSVKVELVPESKESSSSKPEPKKSPSTNPSKKSSSTSNSKPGKSSKNSSTSNSALAPPEHNLKLSNSLLRRRRLAKGLGSVVSSSSKSRSNKAEKKSELQILIPSTHEDDDQTTPTPQPLSTS